MKSRFERLHDAGNSATIESFAGLRPEIAQLARRCANESWILNPAPPRSKLLETLAPHERQAFLKRCTQRCFPAGATVFRQNCAHKTYLIKSGLIRTYYSSPMGKEITLAYWSAGNLIGGPFFFDDHLPNVWSGRAVEDSVVLWIRGTDLRKLAAQMPKVAECVFDSLSFKLYWVSLLLQTLATDSVYYRLLHLLAGLADLYGERCDEGIAIRYSFTQEDLANMVGATRQWVSTALGRLQRDGIVRMRKRRLIIVDPRLLGRHIDEVPTGIPDR